MAREVGGLMVERKRRPFDLSLRMAAARDSSSAAGGRSAVESARSVGFLAASESRRISAPARRTWVGSAEDIAAIGDGSSPVELTSRTIGRKRGHPSLMEGRTIDSAFQELKINYEKTKHHPIGKAIYSDAFSTGSHMWIIKCYLRGVKESEEGKYMSIFVMLASNSRSVKATFEASLVGRCDWTFSPKKTPLCLSQGQDCGWHKFVSHDDLLKEYVIDGHITFMCGVVVINDRSIPVPPSDIGKYLGTLMDKMGPTCHSLLAVRHSMHTAVLAARSPVFRAELLGSMAEAAMSTITLHGIAPTTFMYTDAFPGDKELGESHSEMMQHLLAAADRYALDRLKLMCAQKLWSDVSVDTVASTLACAEMYNCPELRKNCIDFFAAEKNFKKAVLTPVQK
ncbi:hypothetical protein EJB05_48128, partial [Eragrostis curvula]